MPKFSDDFLRGQSDCESGKASLQGQPEEYYRGYGSQYEEEQLLGELTQRQEDDRQN